MVLKGMNVQRPIAETDTGASTPDYDTDFYAWLMEQATRLAARDTDALDWDNLAEEIESLGRSQHRELCHRIEIILEHLLKYEFGKRREPSAGWKRTLHAQRRDLERLLHQSPSLKGKVNQALQSEYRSARQSALFAFEEFEADLAQDYAVLLPLECPYSAEIVLDAEQFPAPKHL